MYPSSFIQFTTEAIKQLFAIELFELLDADYRMRKHLDWRSLATLSAK
jgi:hypothetical protein